MSRTRFLLKEMEALKENPWVNSVSALRVQYSLEFKKHFLEEYEAGKRPTVISVSYTHLTLPTKA